MTLPRSHFSFRKEFSGREMGMPAFHSDRSGLQAGPELGFNCS